MHPPPDEVLFKTAFCCHFGKLTKYSLNPYNLYAIHPIQNTIQPMLLKYPKICLAKRNKNHMPVLVETSDIIFENMRTYYLSGSLYSPNSFSKRLNIRSRSIKHASLSLSKTNSLRQFKSAILILQINPCKSRRQFVCRIDNYIVCNGIKARNNNFSVPYNWFARFHQARR